MFRGTKSLELSLDQPSRRRQLRHVRPRATTSGHHPGSRRAVTAMVLVGAQKSLNTNIYDDWLIIDLCLLAPVDACGCLSTACPFLRDERGRGPMDRGPRGRGSRGFVIVKARKGSP